ncbi:MAG: ion transporter [Butyrivibrio sp.]|nr:ion transporter [Butyrivibrio sp.]
MKENQRLSILPQKEFSTDNKARVPVWGSFAFRNRLYDILETGKDGDIPSKIYDFFMMIVIVISIIPLWSHKDTYTFILIDKITVIIFIIDYILRWFTADFKINRGKMSYVLYPLSFMAIIDLLSILPSLSALGRGFKLFKIFRLMRTFKVFRIFKAVRYSKSINMIINVFRKQKDSLLVVGGFALFYIAVSALVMFNAEPETFPTMFDSFYWATISLTTVGYGDVYATSQIGKVITMFSSVLGIAIVALPASIIIAGYQEEVQNQRKESKSTVQMFEEFYGKPFSEITQEDLGNAKDNSQTKE